MITIWHNPRCTKSRNALAAIEEFDHSIRRYLDDAPSADEIKEALEQLALAPIQMMRRKEKLFKELDLKAADDAALIQAMADHPILIERPILFANGRAVMARDPDAISGFLATL